MAGPKILRPSGAPPATWPEWLQSLAMVSEALPAAPLAAIKRVGFHGTSLPFDKLADRVTWFAKRKRDALKYALNRSRGPNPRVYKAQLEFQNPAKGRDLYEVAEQLGLKPEDFNSQAAILESPSVVKELQRRGYDGVIDAWDYGLDSSQWDPEIAVDAIFNKAPIKTIRESVIRKLGK